MSDILFKAVDIAELENAKALENRENACAEAESIRAQARAEAERILAEAEKNARLAERKGEQKGRDAGFREGLAEVSMVAERIRSVLVRLTEEKDRMLASAEDELASLALEIAEKIVKRSCEEYRETAVENIRHALTGIGESSEVTIRVNLEDIDISQTHLMDFQSACSDGGKIKIVPDPSVERGGCIVETGSCRIDATVSSQLRAVERIWKDVREV